MSLAERDNIEKTTLFRGFLQRRLRDRVGELAKNADKDGIPARLRKIELLKEELETQPDLDAQTTSILQDLCVLQGWFSAAPLATRLEQLHQANAWALVGRWDTGFVHEPIQSLTIAEAKSIDINDYCEGLFLAKANNLHESLAGTGFLQPVAEKNLQMLVKWTAAMDAWQGLDANLIYDDIRCVEIPADIFRTLVRLVCTLRLFGAGSQQDLPTGESLAELDPVAKAKLGGLIHPIFVRAKQVPEYARVLIDAKTAQDKVVEAELAAEAEDHDDHHS
eukprot:6491375-Amphidinium_carterae.2